MLVSGTEGSGMYGYAMNKPDLLGRLKRIEGQVRGLQRMIEEDEYCIDILTQLNSVTAALKAVGIGLLDGHARHCLRESFEQGEGDAKVDEMVAAVARFVGR
jgi:DNA-binding FrmR family transcriptional regulator